MFYLFYVLINWKIKILCWYVSIIKRTLNLPETRTFLTLDNVALIQTLQFNLDKKRNNIRTSWSHWHGLLRHTQDEKRACSTAYNAFYVNLWFFLIYEDSWWENITFHGYREGWWEFVRFSWTYWLKFLIEFFLCI